MLYEIIFNSNRQLIMNEIVMYIKTSLTLKKKLEVHHGFYT